MRNTHCLNCRCRRVRCLLPVWLSAFRFWDSPRPFPCLADGAVCLRLRVGRERLLLLLPSPQPPPAARHAPCLSSASGRATVRRVRVACGGGRLAWMAMKGKFGLVCGVVNQRSIAWAVAQSWRAAGCDVALTYQDERAKPKVERLVAEAWGDDAAAGCAYTPAFTRPRLPLGD